MNTGVASSVVLYDPAVSPSVRAARLGAAVPVRQLAGAGDSAASGPPILDRAGTRNATQRARIAAELALQTMQERYQVGAVTLVELTQARAVGVQAASAIVSARYNLLFQRTLMDYYIGVLNPETVR